MNYKWVLLEKPEEAKIQLLSSQINLNPVLSSILVQRGIETFNEARNFFRPALENLFDPFLMKDMHKAVERLTEAISGNEKILIYGDYDVDGTTSVALVYLFLSEVYPNIDYYIPDRYTEGYGISKQGIDYAIKEGFNLIIALDCGIRSIELVDYAQDNNIDFIICDHHTPGDKLPNAIATLDPKRSDCTYPFKDLSGCGIGFKLLSAFCIQHSMDFGLLYGHLDLVALSIAADIVPVVSENRILAYHGLRVINDDPSVGLNAIIKASSLRKPISISNLVFAIAPRINASGRVKHGSKSVAILIEKDMEKAVEMSHELNVVNQSRKNYDQTVSTEALELINNDFELKTAKTTVLYNDAWHKGVIGIAASRCLESYYRPTIILTKSGQYATGSARSIQGFDIHSAIEACSELLLQYGGHKFAAGLTLEIEKIPAFRKRFEEVVSKKLNNDDLVPKLIIDHKLNFDQITWKFYNILCQMEPFGPGNMNPIFWSENCFIDGQPRILKEKHLKMTVRQKNNFQYFDAIGFNLGKLAEKIKNKASFRMAYSIAMNEYQGNKTLQFNIRDIE